MESELLSQELEAKVDQWQMRIKEGRIGGKVGQIIDLNSIVNGSVMEVVHRIDPEMRDKR